MEKIYLLLLIYFLITPLSGYSQDYDQIRKERRELMNISRDELNKKSTKASRKEAKKLKKENWDVAPGALPLEKQLDRSYLMQMQFDEDGFPKFLMGEAMSIGGNYDAARMQAVELAKQNLAGQIQTEITALVENSVANEQLSEEEANTVTKTLIASKNLISQRIGRTILVVECYRTLSNKNKEVLIRMAYNSKMAKQAAKRTLEEQLGEELDNLHNKLDKAMGW